jgi:sugar lactone lactonase YvrE
MHLYVALLAVSTLIEGVRNPYGLTIGPDAALYYCSIDDHAIRRYDLKTKKTTTVLDTGLKQPYEVRFDKTGDLYFVDMPSHVVSRIDTKTGAVSRIAGTGEPGFSGDAGPAVKAQLRQPHAIEFDPFGGLLIADIGNNRIRRVNLDTGNIDTLLGGGDVKLNGPRAIAFDSQGAMYIALREGNAVYKLDRDGRTIKPVVGTGQKGYTGDGGPALAATLNGPKGITISPQGAMYLADTENHVIRKVDLKTGIITTVAKDLKRPHGVYVDDKGVLYIGDSENHRILVLR